jgi:MFS family permease
MLGALYVVQGLPFGIQATVLPVLLRREGTSLELIGFASALAAPWMGKILWAPFVDARWSPRLGRRRSWILPCQLGLTIALVAASRIDPARELAALLALLFVMNLLTATMDIAVDGLAVELLAPHELGPGNAAQVVGFKLGMITTGGLLLASVSRIGWEGLFLLAAGVVAVVLAATLAWREPESAESSTPTRVREVARVLALVARRPGVIWVLLFIATYKLGESAADTMWKPFLVDAGYDDAQIGLWVGTYGMVASLVGSIAGGLVARRVPLLGAVALTASLRALPLAGQCLLAITGATDEGVIAVTLSEHFFGGALTTTMFAFMMSQVDRRIGGTHFTALAAVEVLGKSPASLLSGVLARQLGYAGVFGVASALSLLFLAALLPMRAAMRRAQGAGG